MEHLFKSHTIQDVHQLMFYVLCSCRQDSFSSNWFLELAIVIPWYLSSLQLVSDEQVKGEHRAITVFSPLVAANMSQGFEIGKYSPGWQYSTSAKDMWFWLLQGNYCRLGDSVIITNRLLNEDWLITQKSFLFSVFGVALSAQINCWHTSLHCSRGPC
jgi:hypothetical protein